MKKFIALLLAFVFAFALIGCDGDVVEEVTSITVTGTAQIQAGQTTQLTANVKPDNLKDAKLVWTSSDTTVATVDQSGKVSGIKDGTATITAQAENGVKGTRKVKVSEDIVDVFPDLGGYVITIAQADTNLHDFDPNLDGYNPRTREARLAAWEQVAEDFNCEFAVEAYPASAPWGPSRWAYINQQASLGVADYDFYTVPDSQIGNFVEGNALIDLTEFEMKYYKNPTDPTFRMDPSWKTSGSYGGKLYSLVEGTNSIYNVMYYNIGLWEKLVEKDPTLVEPAQLFLDGEWTYDNFKEYCIKAQTALGMLYGEQGTANNSNQTYYAMSGWDAYWWAGLCTNDGIPLADSEKLVVNFEHPNKVSAIETLKALYEAGVVDKTQAVDGAVESWTAGHSLFNTGDLWFVRNDTRWSATQWGEGTTKYGYVPFPMPNGNTLEDYQIAVGGTATWVMPIGREYAGFNQASPETIYQAVVEMFKRTKIELEGSPSYDEDSYRKSVAERFTDSEASLNAYIYITKLVENGKVYYDPLCHNDNPVASLYSNSEGTIKYAVTGFVSAGREATWNEAAKKVVPNIKEALLKAFSD